MEYKPLTFIGAGNMSKSIISGLLRAGYPSQLIMACNPSLPKLIQLEQEMGIHISQDNNQGIKFGEVVVLAVKPQIMENMCSDLAMHGQHENTLFVSIAAGISVERLYAMLGKTVPLVRVMPNTPSLLGKGMSGLFAPNNICEKQKAFVGDMMSAVGKILWVKEEQQINGIIAAAGSSPAYFFLFLQAIEEEAIRIGFEPDDARLLVEQAMLGASEMVCHNPNLDLSALRAQVTSKGGTTAQAVQTFIDQGLFTMVSNAMKAAVDRAIEMESTF